MPDRPRDAFDNARLRDAVLQSYGQANAEARAKVDAIRLRPRDQTADTANTIVDTYETLRAQALALVDGGVDRSKFDGLI